VDEQKTTAAEREPARIQRWRFEQLVAAGYPENYADRLARNPDVDLHRAVDILTGGCSLELAVDILT
jgi:hypothetical protein